MNSSCTAWRQIRSRVLRQWLAPVRVGTEVMAQLVDASLRTTSAVWTQFLKVPIRSETHDDERTAERHPRGPRPAADGTRPGRPRPDAEPTMEREARPVSALTQPSSPELVPDEKVSTHPVHVDEPSTDRPAPDESLARTTPGADTRTGSVDVTFRVPAAAGAHSAHVCGEFNDWSTTADPMDRRDDGSLELVRALPVGRRWRFRYLVDGNRWENDWTADDYPTNAFGDHDSVVDLRTPSASRLVSGRRPLDA